MKTERVDVAVADGTVMSCYVARPDDDMAHPGLIVFQEAFGVNPHIRDITERFAREGYVAIAPELFHRTTPGFEAEYVEKRGVSEQMAALSDDGLRADITAAFQWLISQPFVEKERVGAIGFCMGGRAAFLASTTLPLSAAVSFYGGGITAHLPLVQEVRSPLLLLWGGLDTHIPVSDRTSITEALTAASKEFVNVEFSYAGHGFFCDARASYHPRAAREAWPLVLEFLKGNLTT